MFFISCQAYPTNISLINFSVPRKFLITTRFLITTWFAISARVLILWSSCLSKNEIEIDIFLLFKHRAKEKNVELSTAANFLQ